MPKYSTPNYMTNDFVPFNMTVDMNNQDMKTVSANTSTRMPLGVENERGEITYGYFTANEYNNVHNIFNSRFLQVENNPDFAEYAPVGAAFKRLSEGEDFVKTCGEWYAFFGMNIMSKDKTHLAFPKGKSVESFHISNIRGQKGRDLQNKFIEYLKRQGVDAAMLDRSRDDNRFWDYITRTMEVGYRSYRAYYLNYAHKLADDKNVNKRNNATYDYAVLLKQKNIICKSSSMTVRSGRHTLEGSFMVNARGTDKNKWDPRKDDMGYRPIVIEASAVRDLSKLQVMDFLCGNVDRHPGNMFYELDKSDPEHVRIIGIQGIDNDASFGTPEFKGKGVSNVYMSRIEDIKVMDREMAMSVLALEPEEMEEKIRLAGLAKEEIAAAHERLAALKQRLLDGKIKLLSTEEEWKEYSSPEGSQKLRFSAKKGYNIFDNAYFAVEQYNKYVAQGLNDEGPFPVSRKVNSYDPPVPVGKSMTADMRVNLTAHMKELQRIQGGFSEIGSLTQNPEEFMPVYQALQDGIAEMNALNDKLDQMAPTLQNGFKPNLLDEDRNKLILKLDKIRAFADRFAEKNDPPKPEDKNPVKTMNVTHLVRDLSAYLKYAKMSINNDAAQAEMDMVSKLGHQMAKDNGLVRDDQLETRMTDKSTRFAESKETMGSIDAKLGEVDSKFKRSSAQFKEIVKNLKAIKDNPPKDIIAAQVMYNKLMDSAQKYIDYKDPTGKQIGLSEYEKNRVKFAEKVKEFGAAEKYKAKLKEGEKAKLKEDIEHLKSFTEKYNDLSMRCTNVVSGNEKMQDSLKELWEDRQNFMNGYRTLLTISESYPETHPIQTKCYQALLDSKFAICLTQFRRAYNTLIGGEEKSAYDILKMNSREIKGVNAVYNRSKAAQAAQEEKAAQAENNGPKVL